MNSPQQLAEQKLLEELQARQAKFEKKLKENLPTGYELIVTVQLKPTREAIPNTRPETIGQVLDQFSFFVCGYQLTVWRRVAAWIIEDQANVLVLDFLKKHSEEDLLRTPNFGTGGLEKIYRVLRWHGYRERFREK